MKNSKLSACYSHTPWGLSILLDWHRYLLLTGEVGLVDAEWCHLMLVAYSGLRCHRGKESRAGGAHLGGGHHACYSTGNSCRSCSWEERGNCRLAISTINYGYIHKTGAIQIQKSGTVYLEHCARAGEKYYTWLLPLHRKSQLTPLNNYICLKLYAKSPSLQNSLCNGGKVYASDTKILPTREIFMLGHKITPT